jgi:hypothetical protein
VPVRGGHSGPQRESRRDGWLSGEQTGLDMTPPCVAGAVRTAEVLPGLGRGLPRRWITWPDEPAAFGLPAGALTSGGGQERVVGERGSAHSVYPCRELIGGGHGRLGRGVVVAGSGAIGQVGAAAHAHDQQPSAENGQVWLVDAAQHPQHVVERFGGATRPRSQLCSALRRFAGEFTAGQASNDDIELLLSLGRGGEVAAQQVELHALAVNGVTVAVRWSGG